MRARSWRGVGFGLVLMAFAAVFFTAGTARAATIDEIGPGWGAIGDTIRIRGYGFDAGAVGVVFNPGNVEATVTGFQQHDPNDPYSLDSITCTVPKGATGGTGTVSVTINGSPGAGHPFWVADDVNGMVQDGHGQGAPESISQGAVVDAKVELTNKATEEVYATDYTLKGGYFRIRHPLDNSVTYRLKVTLETEDKNLKMDYKGGDTITFSHDFTYSNANESTENLFPLVWKLTDTTLTDDSNIPKDDLDNCASVWSWLIVNRQVAKAAGYTIGNPVTVSTFIGGTSYSRDSRTIFVEKDDIDDDAADDPYPPPWVFQKNRESHEFGHALMHSIYGGGWVAPRDVGNHAGYINSNSGDSLSEGFAEFWACYVDLAAGITGSPDVYDGSGSIGALGVWRAWSPLITSKPVDPPLGGSDEEFAAATLLYKLEQSVGFKAIAQALPKGAEGTVTGFYNRISPGRVAKVQSLMWALGFFSDKDGDWVHDAGEPVGAGNGTPCKMKYQGVVHNLPARLTRQKRPMEPNEMVRITLSGISDLSQESWVTVGVAATGNPAAGYSYRAPVIGDTGLVSLPIPPGCDATITAAGPDGQPSSDSLVITAEEWAAAKAAIPVGAALSTTLAVPPPGPGVKTYCSLGADAETIDYGSAATLSGEITSAGEYISDVQIQLQSSTNGADWSDVDAPVWSGDGLYEFVVAPGETTSYRVVSLATAAYWSSASRPVVVQPRARLGDPVAPAFMSRTRAATVKVQLQPGHAVGSFPVRVYKWVKTRGGWKASGSVQAKAVSTGAASKCTVKLRLKTRGVWRLRALHEDAGHAATWSPGYDFVVVR